MKRELLEGYVKTLPVHSFDKTAIKPLPTLTTSGKHVVHASQQLREAADHGPRTCWAQARVHFNIKVMFSFLPKRRDMCMRLGMWKPSDGLQAKRSLLLSYGQ